MKKRNIILGIVSAMALFLLTGCGSKTVISTETFINKTKASGYTITDVSSQYAKYETIKEATVAQREGLQIEFYVLIDKENAQSMFNTNKTTFEGFKGSSSTELSSNMGNYSSYTLNSSGYYMHLCRVDNTLLYVRVDQKYKDTVKEIINELGY